jgi:tRNA-specific 2-thiouridylase
LFKKEIINEFRDQYTLGKTPNPCVTCNRIIKFGELLQSAHDYGAYYLATGHYSKIEFDENSQKYKVLKGDAKGKDQAYMFHVLTQDKLKYIKFPLGIFNTKDEIREIAKKVDIDISKKKDSQDICFIKDDDYVKYLTQDLSVKSEVGNFVDINGKILGKHKGIINYTIGQRRGLGISFGEPIYVIEIRVKANEVVVGTNELTFKKGLIANKYNFLSIKDFDKLKVDVKIRYSAKPSKAVLYKIDEENIKVIFDNKERAITPGQAVVFYLNNEVIGGAIVVNSFD